MVKLTQVPMAKFIHVLMVKSSPRPREPAHRARGGARSTNEGVTSRDNDFGLRIFSKGLRSKNIKRRLEGGFKEEAFKQKITVKFWASFIVELYG